MIVIVVKPYVGFPNGTATTSRVTAYARGLAVDRHLGLDPELAGTAVDEAATIMAECAGWSEARRASEIDSYFRYAGRFRLAAPDVAVSAPS